MEKIAFIICTNSETISECLWWIGKLKVPKGYEIEVIEIHDAKSMTSGYNEGMRSSDARYKIYLHQDVFCINKYMLYELLDVFEDSSIGMIGVLGATTFDKSAKFSLTWDYGRCLACDGEKLYELNAQSEHIKCKEAAMLDGMFLATQYDLPWNEEEFDGWHFYDASQCMNFREAGYRIAIPTMKKDWVIHDAGYCSYSGWDQYRKRFCEKYSNDFEYDDVFVSPQEKHMDGTKTVISLVEKKDYEGAVRKIDEMKILNKSEMNSDLFYAILFLEIYINEMKQYNQSLVAMFEKMDCFREYYDKMRFCVWRFEYGKSLDDLKLLLEELKNGNISWVFVNVLVKHSTKCADDVLDRINKHLQSA